MSRFDATEFYVVVEPSRDRILKGEKLFDYRISNLSQWKGKSMTAEQVAYEVSEAILEELNK